ncbi:MAG: uracil-DNA glycosylase [Clostridia bacterium]|nr:uracil-DNA glycosylase [Clostridia bacterium]
MKKDQLQVLNEELKQHIDAFYKQATPLVYGGGDPDSRIVLIGEAPGKNEVLQGKPFVGQAGKNLDQFIEILGIEKTDLYITNVVKMRPYKINESTGRESNRTPTKKEVGIFSSFLMRELEIIKPSLVVTLGNIALKCITQDENSSIGKMHGEPVMLQFGSEKFNLFPLYHPASIIYKADLKDIYLQDLHKLKAYLKSLNL